MAVVKVPRELALAVLKHCGFKSANNWDDKKIQDKLPSIPDVAPKEPPTDPDVVEALRMISETVASKGDFEVFSEQPTNTTSTEGQVAAEKVVSTPPAKKESPYQRVKPMRSAPFIAGQVLGEFGLEKGVTDEMIARYNKLKGKENNGVAEANLMWSWHVLRGAQEVTQPKTPQQETQPQA